MRHSVYGKHLSRDKNGRTALFRSLVRSLFLSENIQTTEAKAKAIKGLVDKIVNQAKTPARRSLVSQFVTDKKVAERLIKEIAPRFSDRKSGYTTLKRLGKRLGDGAMMVRMELVEGKKVAPKEETKKEVKKEEKKKEQKK